MPKKRESRQARPKPVRPPVLKRDAVAVAASRTKRATEILKLGRPATEDEVAEAVAMRKNPTAHLEPDERAIVDFLRAEIAAALVNGASGFERVRRAAAAILLDATPTEAKRRALVLRVAHQVLFQFAGDGPHEPWIQLSRVRLMLADERFAAITAEDLVTVARELPTKSGAIGLAARLSVRCGAFGDVATPAAARAYRLNRTK